MFLRTAHVGALGILLVLAGCGRVHVKPVAWHHHDVTTCQARLSDVALPLAITPVDASTGCSTFAYTVKSSRDELMRFYEREMERMGWIVLGHAETDESICAFEKPSRLCIVSIRQKLTNTNKPRGTRGAPSASFVRIDVINKIVSTV